MAQDAMAVFAHGRARRLHHDAFGKEDRLVGQNERALSLPESHTRRISAPSCNSWQGDAILSLCETGGSGHVDRHVCRDDCLAQRHGDVAGGGVQEPTAARRRVIVQHRAVIARRSRANASYRDQFAHAR